jgi:hypothetical protein
MKNPMKTSIKFFLLFFLLFGSNQTLFASKVIGSQIFYQASGTPNVYIITVKLFRDCGGLELCANCPTSLSSSCSISAALTGTGSCNGLNFGSQSLSVVTAVSGFDVIQDLVGSKTICSNCGSRTPGTFPIGVEIYTFTGVVNLSSISCCKVRVSFTLGTKNASNSVLMNAGSLDYYNEIIIDKCANSMDMLPHQYYYLPFYVQTNKFNVINLAMANSLATDSISYELSPIYTSTGVVAPYKSGYSATVPFPYVGAPTSNPALLPNSLYLSPDGLLMFKVSSMFVADVNIKIKKWRKDSLGVYQSRSESTTNFQITSYPNNSASSLNLLTYDTLGNKLNPNSSLVKTIALCPGQTYCEYAVGNSNSTLDTTYLDFITTNPNDSLTVSRSFNPATRTTTGPRLDSVRFCWTMPDSTNSKSFYSLTTKIWAKGNPLKNIAYQVYQFEKSTSPPILAITKTKTSTRRYSFKYVLFSYHLLNKFDTQWKFETNPGSNVFQTIQADSISSKLFLNGGTYKFQLVVSNPCGNYIYWDSIVIPAFKVSAIQNQINPCFGDSKAGISASVVENVGPVVYRINNQTYQNSNQFSGLPAGNYWVIAEDSVQQKDSAFIGIQEPQKLGLNPSILQDILCHGNQNGKVQLTPINGKSPFQFKLENGSFSTSNLFSSLGSGTHHFYVLDSNQCAADTFISLANPPQFFSTISSTQESCLGKMDATASISISGGNPPTLINWQSNPIQQGNTAINLGSGWLKVICMDNNNCSYQDSVLITTKTPFSGQQFCAISIDTATYLSKLFWYKTPSAGTAKYLIYASLTPNGTYTLVDSISFDAPLPFIDPSTTNPQMYYKIKTVDSCGVTSSFSNFHRAIHLGSTLLPSGVNLSWSLYEGASGSQQKVWRRSNNGSYQLLSSLSNTSNNFLDSFPAIGNNTYLIEWVKDNSCLNGNTPFPVYSNQVSHTISTGMLESKLNQVFKVYPNPSEGVLFIQKASLAYPIEEIKMFTLEGKLVQTWQANEQQNIEELSISDLENGYYQLLISCKNGLNQSYPILLRRK